MNKKAINNQKITRLKKIKQNQQIFSFVLYCDLLYSVFCSGDF